MSMRRRCAVLGAGIMLILPSYLFSGAPPAAADCTENDGITLCQNVVRGANAGPPDEPWVPYPCDLDYLCDDGVSVFDNNDNNNNADRPNNDLPGRDFGRPGRPGDRPGGGGGIGGGR